MCSSVRIKKSGTAVLVTSTKTVDEGFDGVDGAFVEDEVFGQNVYYIFQGVRNINIAKNRDTHVCELSTSWVLATLLYQALG